MASSRLFQIFSLFSIFLLFYPFSCTFTHQNSTGSSENEDYMHEIESLRHVAVVDGERIVFRVVNGIPAKLGDVPYQVPNEFKKLFFINRVEEMEPEGVRTLFHEIALMMQVRTRYSAICGGTIIGPKKVLTAAHCIEMRKISECKKGKLSSSAFKGYRIVAGQLNTNARYGQEGQWRTILSGHFPKKYRFPKDDIALLYTKTEFEYNYAVQPIAYATKDIDYKNDCLASGYGRLSATVQSEILMMAYLSPLSKRLCDRIHRQNFEKFICTSDITTDVFKGDSGGPLVCKGTGDPAENKSEKGIVAGVVSGKDLHQRMGTFFIRVSSYYNFVNCVSRCEAGNWFLLCLILVYLFRTQY